MTVGSREMSHITTTLSIEVYKLRCILTTATVLLVHTYSSTVYERISGKSMVRMFSKKRLSSVVHYTVPITRVVNVSTWYVKE